MISFPVVPEYYPGSCCNSNSYLLVLPRKQELKDYGLLQKFSAAGEEQELGLRLYGNRKL